VITTNAILDTGVRAVRTFQLSLATTAHNITNVSTEGYSRQRADLGTTFPMLHTPGQIGTGVEAQSISRLREPTLENTVRTEISHLGRWTQQRDSLAVLETLPGDATAGNIGSALSEFWNGWQELSTAPEEVGIRSVVVERARSVADAFQDASKRLADFTDGLNQSLSAKVIDANSYTKGIAQLNYDIFRAELTGANANDLRDRRDLLIEKLAELTDVTVATQANGTVDIQVQTAGGPEYLVQGFLSFDMASSDITIPADGYNEVTLSGVEVTSASGRFKGFADDFLTVDATLTSMDNLANALRNTVNAQHALGFDLNGNAGGSFFSGTSAADIDVEAAVASDPALIAASSTAGGVPGNGLNALAIVDIRDQNVLPSGTLNEGFSQLVLDLGGKAREANLRYADYETAVRVVKEQRAAISGVNMDEEVANMLAFQRAYQGAARVITTVDDMMDRIINRTGRVGL